MARALQVDPADPVPIWRQIEDGVRRLIAAGTLPPGAAAPSVRELSRELRVNPATVVRAYQRLVDAGLLTVRRGEGTFVADRPPRERSAMLAAAAARYADAALGVGAGEEEAAEALRAAFAAAAVRGGER